jgi:hypothetical protein
MREFMAVSLGLGSTADGAFPVTGRTTQRLHGWHGCRLANDLPHELRRPEAQDWD